MTDWPYQQSETEDNGSVETPVRVSEEDAQYIIEKQRQEIRNLRSFLVELVSHFESHLRIEIEWARERYPDLGWNKKG